MNKKKVIIISFIVIVVEVIVLLLWKFVVGFRLGIKGKIKNIVNNSSDMSLYVVDNNDEMYLIYNEEDSNEILKILSATRVKYSTDSWIGRAYRLIFFNNKTH